MDANETLNALGMSCPMPIVKLAKKMKEIKDGDVLEVLADDVGAKEDIPAWCNRTENEFLGMEEEDGSMRLYIKKIE